MRGTPSDQMRHWDATYARDAAFFGEEPSGFARDAAAFFRERGARSALELGPGQGRDTAFLARSGLAVTALDYSRTGTGQLGGTLRDNGLDTSVSLLVHDVREPLPFRNESFDACYAHMLLCMRLRRSEIAFALREIHRVLRPGGALAYSVRSEHDPHYRHGVHLGEEMYEIGGFVVHFFDEAMIRGLSGGFEVVGIERMSEGRLPRDLYAVHMLKTGPAPDYEKEHPMQDLGDAMRGGPDPKTRSLLALAACLAAGADDGAREALSAARSAGATQGEIDEAAKAATEAHAGRIRRVVGAPEPLSAPAGPSRFT